MSTTETNETKKPNAGVKVNAPTATPTVSKQAPTTKKMPTLINNDDEPTAAPPTAAPEVNLSLSAPEVNLSLSAAIAIGSDIYQLNKEQTVNYSHQGLIAFKKTFGGYTVPLNRIIQLVQLYFPLEGRVAFIPDPRDRRDVIAFLKERSAQLQRSLEFNSSTFLASRYSLYRTEVEQILEELEHAPTHPAAGPRRPLELTTDQQEELLLAFAYYLTHQHDVPQSIAEEWDTLVYRLIKETTPEDVLRLLIEQIAPQGTVTNQATKELIGRHSNKRVPRQTVATTASTATANVNATPTATVQTNTPQTASTTKDNVKENVKPTAKADDLIRQLLQLLIAKRYLEEDLAEADSLTANQMKRLKNQILINPLAYLKENESKHEAVAASSTANNPFFSSTKVNVPNTDNPFMNKPAASSTANNPFLSSTKVNVPNTDNPFMNKPQTGGAYSIMGLSLEKMMAPLFHQIEFMNPIEYNAVNDFFSSHSLPNNLLRDLLQLLTIHHAFLHDESVKEASRDLAITGLSMEMMELVGACVRSSTDHPTTYFYLPSTASSSSSSSSSSLHLRIQPSDSSDSSKETPREYMIPFTDATPSFQVVETPSINVTKTGGWFPVDVLVLCIFIALKHHLPSDTSTASTAVAPATTNVKPNNTPPVGPEAVEAATTAAVQHESSAP